ncbi:MAG: type II toxin-antitoxin system VapB family antitoxin [Nocardioides sp.]|uniref:type II toxin-antitoxin system VapB family antitoxin n=1 Tax=Nocardioides sp. TaxID=35761 RepID=UPI0039E2DDEE
MQEDVYTLFFLDGHQHQGPDHRPARPRAGRLTGLPITTALREAIEEKLAATRAHQTATKTPGLAAIIARGRSRATIDDRGAEEILGYDGRGLPT